MDKIRTRKEKERMEEKRRCMIEDWQRRAGNISFLFLQAVKGQRERNPLKRV